MRKTRGSWGETGRRLPFFPPPPPPFPSRARLIFALLESLAQAKWANVNAVMQVNNPCDGFDYSFIETHSYCKRHARLKLSAKFILAYSKF